MTRTWPLRVFAASCVVGLLGGCAGGEGDDGAASDGGVPTTQIDADDPALAEVLAGVVGDPSSEPGCAVGVSRDGEVVATATLGLADLEHGTPITASSVFDIGSVSKQFTAATILALADEGVLSPSGELRDTLPDLPPWGGPVTLDHAMHHTSGIPDYVEPLGGEFDPADVTTADDAYVVIRASTTPEFAPGERWSYSNSNFVLLSFVVEEATGSTFEAVLTEQVLDPLGLGDTTVRDHHDEVIAGVAHAYRDDPERGWVVDMTDWEQVGDGAMQSTIGDLLAWQAALSSGDALGFDLGASLRFAPVDMGDGVTSYGRGVLIREDGGITRVGHVGSEAGYRSAVESIPDEGLAAAVLCNRGDVDADNLVKAALETQRSR